jgi:glycosyltransferase involved in cell wall biosynthesis
MSPFVTALLDTYNHERYIEQAIVSAIEQDFPSSDVEILVVDDGSTDRTPEIVRKFEPKVRLLRKENGGQASAINFGTAQANGQIVAFLDGDDLWSPNKLSSVVKEFGKNPQTVMVYHKFRFWDDREDTSWDGWFTGVTGDILSDRRKLLAYSPPPTSSLAFRREILKRLMPVPVQCSFMHDAYLIATAICLGPVGAVPQCLTTNRVHGQNLWFTKKEQPNAEVLRGRIEVRAAAIESVRNWIMTNGSRPAQSEISGLLSAWQLMQEEDKFQLRSPGRPRYFLYLCRHNLTFRPALTPGRFAYNWVYAFVTLIAGRENALYLEGVRTRVRRLLHYLGRRFRPAEGMGRSL